jgi:hypothetical protein
LKDEIVWGSILMSMGWVGGAAVTAGGESLRPAHYHCCQLQRIQGRRLLLGYKELVEGGREGSLNEHWRIVPVMRIFSA